tara:strand:- start:180 stop:659 length:480 start_codon:yes stop_codon:yes gene_type:complete
MDEIKKQKKRESNRKYREKNKEKINNNKERNREYQKEYRQKNKEKNKEYRHTPSCQKSITKYNWKIGGLYMDNFEEVYQRYLSTTNCDRCSVLLTTGDNCKTTKCMDHCHYTSKFRRVLCLSCNFKEKRQPKYNEDIEVFLARTHREQNLAEHNIIENM